MGEDPGAAQARELLREMNGQLADISHRLDKVQRRHQRRSARGAMLDRRQVSSLNRELHEAHRLIDGLHRRFPDALGAEHATCSPAR